MPHYGIKVTKEGADVTSNEPRDYILSSKYGSVKIVQEPPNRTYVTMQVNASSTNTLQVDHNLGFIPLVMVFTELNPGSGRWYNGVAVADPTDLSASEMYVNSVNDGTYVDSSSVYIKYSNQSASNKTIKIYYFILGDDGV